MATGWITNGAMGRLPHRKDGALRYVLGTDEALRYIAGKEGAVRYGRGRDGALRYEFCASAWKVESCV
jgi:hypothetical protein